MSFKKAQVCKVIEHCMAKCGRYKYSEAEKLNFQEANKLLDIEDTLEFAVQVYEDVRSNRQALLKDIMRQTCPSGNFGLPKHCILLFRTFMTVDPNVLRGCRQIIVSAT